MATSSSSPQDHPPPSQPPTASRRLPPPCWSHEETIALIDAYCHKWYSLRRGNLRATHWQEVADSVADRCPLPADNPTKTSVQCRHKMEKLRKRYRAEVQRSLTNPKAHPYCSSWVHFNRMDSMEKGPSLKSIQMDVNEDEEEDDEDQDEPYDPRFVKRSKIIPSPIQTYYGPGSNGISNGNSFRIRFPGQTSMTPQTGTKHHGKFVESVNPNPRHKIRSGKPYRDGYSGGKSGAGERTGKKREGSAVVEMVAAIKALGDGFVRVERMKMEMAREVEAMRMDMEMKRTQIILESQQIIVEAFSKSLLEKENNKAERILTPES